jgi:DNA-binding MarR family transcriptional regulator
MRRQLLPARRTATVRLSDPLAFLQCLWAVDHGLQSISKRMRQSMGLTGPQRLIVRVLAGTPDLTPGQLAGVLHLHPSTLTGILRRLQAQGLIARRVDRHDRRRAVVRLTRAAGPLRRLRRGTIEAAVHRTLVQVGPADAAATRRVLLALAAELDNERPQTATRHVRGGR